MTISSVKRGLIDDSMLLGLPGAMAAPTATDGGTGTTASIAFTTVSGATSYTVVSSPATTSQTASSSPYTFTGLTAGTAYTFSIAATNENPTLYLPPPAQLKQHPPTPLLLSIAPCLVRRI